MIVFTLEHIGHTVIQTLPLLFNIISAQMYLILQHGVFKMANSPLPVFIMHNKVQLI